MVEISPAPAYGDGHYMLRSTCDITAGVSVLRESPLAYLPIFTFHTTRDAAVANKTLLETSQFSTAPTSTAELNSATRAKNEYFKAGWPHLSPFFTPRTRPTSSLFEHLQLACLLIIRQPLLALSFSKPRSAGGYRPDAPAVESLAESVTDLFPPLTFSHFRLAMKTLCFFGVRRSAAKHWVKFEHFRDLYRGVAANAIYCGTLVTDQRFAVGIYPLSARVNHSCEPNCLRVGTPSGLYTVAIRPIAKGEEITISYFSSYVTGFTDHTHLTNSLKLKCGFSCCCLACKESKFSENPYSRRLEELFTQHSELTADLNRVSDVVNGTENNTLQVMQACDEFRQKYEDILEKEPALSYLISRHYVRLLQPAEDYDVEFTQHSFEYWSDLYRSCLMSETRDTPGPFLIWAHFYPTLYRLFLTNLEFQAAYAARDAGQILNFNDVTTDPTNASGPTGPSDDGGSTVETRLLSRVADFVKHLVHLRHLTRKTLGSHWFLWTEFAMFNGIDVFLDYLEPQVMAEERQAKIQSPEAE